MAMVKAAAKLAARRAKGAKKAKKSAARAGRREQAIREWAAESGADREVEYMREGLEGGYEKAFRRTTKRDATKRGTSTRGEKRRAAREQGYPKKNRVLTKKKIRQNAKKRKGGFIDPRGK